MTSKDPVCVCSILGRKKESDFFRIFSAQVPVSTEIRPVLSVLPYAVENLFQKVTAEFKKIST